MTEKNDLRDILTEQQDCVAELKISFTALNIKYQLLKKCQWADCEGTQQSNTSMTLVVEDKHSLKISDSSLLDDSFNSTWEEWVSKIQTKLSVNEDHYLTEIVCMRYVLFWLSVKTAQHTEFCFSYEFSVINLYHTADEILKNLKKIYENLNKSRNYCQIYIELLQSFKRFSDFYVEFCCLFTFLRYGKTQCMNNLWDKISPHLQISLSS